MKFQIYEVERLYYVCSEKKGADQLRGYHTADLCLYFPDLEIRFSHDAAHNNETLQHLSIIHSGRVSLIVVHHLSIVMRKLAFCIMPKQKRRSAYG